MRLEHCYRESNRAANLLANIGVDQSNSLVIYDDPPTLLYGILFEDNSRVAWPHVIHNE